MSFIRGKYYTYVDGYKYINFSVTYNKSLEVWQSRMPFSTFDELVVMRLAELNKRQIDLAIKRAIKKHKGNRGCQALIRKFNKKICE